MDVTINLSKGDIVLRAKDDTYLSVRSYLVGHEANAQSKYEMQADERATHERKLLNSIGAAVSELKAELSKYRIHDTLSKERDSFELTFEMSDRMDMSRKPDIGRLVEEYLYRKVVAEWWMVNYPDASASYLTMCGKALEDLKKCFSLSAPYEATGGVKYKCLTRRGYRVVLLYKEELVNEIHSEMLKLSRMRKDERGVADLDLQTDEMSDEGLISRYVSRSIGRVCSRVNAYLYGLSNTVDNDMADRQPVYEFKLLMPEGWDGRLFEELAEEMHAYVVNASLYEWLKTAIPDVASVYGAQADEAYQRMKHVVTVRKPDAIYKPLQPF